MLNQLRTSTSSACLKLCRRTNNKHERNARLYSRDIIFTRGPKRFLIAMTRNEVETDLIFFPPRKISSTFLSRPRGDRFATAGDRVTGEITLKMLFFFLIGKSPCCYVTRATTKDIYWLTKPFFGRARSFFFFLFSFSYTYDIFYLACRRYEDKRAFTAYIISLWFKHEHNVLWRTLKRRSDLRSDRVYICIRLYYSAIFSTGQSTKHSFF